jgi:hypothetical protein
MNYRNTTWILTFVALVLFLPLFYFKGFGPVDFWAWMSFNAIVLTTSSLIADKDFRKEIKSDFRSNIVKKILLGIGSAALLYLVFYFGNIISRYILSFAGENISSVYDFKKGASTLKVALLMAFIIAPGEELFWRGFLQRRLSKVHGPLVGFLIATFFYTFMHTTSLNLMLIAASGICGLFWGWCYKRFNSILLNIVSHVVWDLTVFLIIPFS